MLNYVTVVMLLTAISWLTFYLDPIDLSGRSGVALTLLLAVGVFQLILNETMPQTGYLTPMHSFILVSTLFVAMVAVESLVVYKLKLYEQAIIDRTKEQIRYLRTGHADRSSPHVKYGIPPLLPSGTTARSQATAAPGDQSEQVQLRGDKTIAVRAGESVQARQRGKREAESDVSSERHERTRFSTAFSDANRYFIQLEALGKVCNKYNPDHQDLPSVAIIQMADELGLLSDASTVARALTEMESNSDGTISQQEFEDWAKLQIVQMLDAPQRPTATTEAGEHERYQLFPAEVNEIATEMGTAMAGGHSNAEQTELNSSRPHGQTRENKSKLGSWCHAARHLVTQHMDTASLIIFPISCRPRTQSISSCPYIYMIMLV